MEEVILKQLEEKELLPDKEKETQMKVRAANQQSDWWRRLFSRN